MSMSLCVLLVGGVVGERRDTVVKGAGKSENSGLVKSTGWTG